MLLWLWQGVEIRSNSLWFFLTLFLFNWFEKAIIQLTKIRREATHYQKPFAKRCWEKRRLLASSNESDHELRFRLRGAWISHSRWESLVLQLVCPPVFLEMNMKVKGHYFFVFVVTSKHLPPIFYEYKTYQNTIILVCSKRSDISQRGSKVEVDGI